MTISTRTRILLGALVAAMGACSGDDGEVFMPIDSPIVGSWDATSVVINGTDLVPVGLMLELFFDDEGTYDIFVQNDDLGIICDGGATTCGTSGEFTVSATHVTFDPGDPDALMLSYAVSNDQMTLSGTIDGFQLNGIFVRDT